MIKFIQIISVIGAVLMIKASYASPISVKVSGIDIKRKGELYIMLYLMPLKMNYVDSEPRLSLFNNI